jgi:hypothetical protein
MTIITRFRCDICGTTFDSQQSAIKCEAVGRPSVPFKVGDVIFNSRYQRTGWFDGSSDWIASTSCEIRRKYNSEEFIKPPWTQKEHPGLIMYSPYYYITAIEEGKRHFGHAVLLHCETLAFLSAYKNETIVIGHPPFFSSSQWTLADDDTSRMLREQWSTQLTSRPMKGSKSRTRMKKVVTI